MVLKFIASMLRYDTQEVVVQNRIFKAYIADSTIKQMIGLMYRKSIRADECMLFRFTYDAMHGIWMRNMSFPIDVVWLDFGMQVVDIKKNLQPCVKTFGCKTYYPNEKSRFVLEFRSGTATKLKLKIGSKVSGSR